MPIYTAYTVELVPGRRFAGIEHMKKMTAWMQSKFGISSEVLANLAGPVYEHHLVVRFDSLAQMEEITGKMMADPEYLQWFGEAEGLLDWKSARQSLFQVY